jgi:FAD synthase
MKTVLYPFTLRLANRRADTFFRSLKRDLGPIQAIYIGENARFGRGGETDANGLKRLLEPSLTVNIFPSLLHGGKCISSTRIRQALGEGRMEEVNAMLGSPYMVRAWLQSGKRKDLTRFTLGWDPEAKPRFGTYRVRVVSVSTPSLSIEGLAHYGTEATLSPLLDVRLQSPWPSEGEPSPVEIEWIQCLQPGKTFPSMGKKDKETTHSLENSETFPIVSPHFS